MKVVNRRPGVVLVVAVLIAAGTVLAIALSDRRRALWHALEHFQSAWAIVAVAAELLAYAGYILAYRETVLTAEGSQRPSLSQTVQLVVAGFGPSVAAGGFAFDRRALRALNYTRRRARIQVLGLAVTEYLLLAPAAFLCALILLLGSRRASPLLTWPWIIGVPVGFLIGWWATHPRIVKHFKHSDGRIQSWIADLLGGVEILRSVVTRPIEHLAAILGVALYWTAEIVCLGFALRCFGVEISVAALVLAYATGYAASRRSLPLGGAGMIEALLTISLIAVHVPAARALLGVLVYRVINFLIPMLLGLLAHYSLGSILEARAPR